ncbi:hypothetical protein [Ralstonia pseudosolanacearum]|uniref:hypothetical protein n=1 Tax=Ralstonia pseudosolanacearum TaxID=1310165 RepID=UPI0018D0711B|nr:hypothetical protein [Ralstonia pseudosolanacearum]
MKQRKKPSASRLSKGLWRQAHEAEEKAAKLRELGFDRYANSVAAAANAFSDAAIFLEEKANK